VAKRNESWNVISLADAPKSGNNSIELSSDRSGLEATLERDRQFFKCPSVHFRIHTKHHAWGIPLSQLPRGCEAHGVVTVRRLAPGLRLRLLKPDFFLVILNEGQRR
jgi:hypothetical protein